MGGGLLGLSAAEALVREQDESVSLGQFKFFFNYGEWAPGMLEKEVSSSYSRPLPLPVPHRASLTRSLAACWVVIRSRAASGTWWSWRRPPSSDRAQHSRSARYGRQAGSTRLKQAGGRPTCG